jgi:hypothetical protein
VALINTPPPPPPKWTQQYVSKVINKFTTYTHAPKNKITLPEIVSGQREGRRVYLLVP